MSAAAIGPADGRRLAPPRPTIVAPAGDVDRADRDLGACDRPEELCQARGEGHAPGVDADEDDAVEARRLAFDDLVRHAPQGPGEALGVEDAARGGDAHVPLVRAQGTTCTFGSFPGSRAAGLKDWDAGRRLAGESAAPWKRGSAMVDLVIALVVLLVPALFFLAGDVPEPAPARAEQQDAREPRG